MTPNTKYHRVIPRDLFNEAKLLKCVGRLCLLIHDRMTPVQMEFNENGEPFIIGLMDDGHLTVTNLEITVCGKLFTFKTTHNSKSNYPLLVEARGYEEIEVFDDNGEFTIDFRVFAASEKAAARFGKTLDKLEG